MTPAIPSAPGIEAAVTAIVVSLLNTFWIPAAAGIGLALAFRFLRGWNAATRYALCWALLATVFLAPLVPSFFTRELAAAPEPIPLPSAPIAATIPDEPVDLPQPIEPAPEIATDPVNEPMATAPLTPEFSIEEHAPSGLRPSDLPAESAPPALTLTPGPWTWIVLALWFTWALYRSLRIGQSYLYLRHIKSSAEPADHPSNGALKARFAHLRTEHGIRPSARLLISRNIAAPIAVGFFHPAVILPETLADRLSPAELDHLLLHEAGHLARWDDWTNLAAKLIGAVSGLHPIAAWALHRLDREREQACDEWVVAATGASKLYAASLTRLFELTHPQRHLLASAIYERTSELGARVERILRLTHASRKLSRGALSIAAVLLAGALITGGGIPPIVTYAAEAPAAPKTEAAIVASSPEDEIQTGGNKDFASPLLPELSDSVKEANAVVAQLDAPQVETPGDESPAVDAPPTTDPRPLTLGLVIDESGSARDGWTQLTAALVNFLEDLQPPKTFLIFFSNEPRLIVPPSSGPLAQMVIEKTGGARGGTSLYDALAMAMEQARAENDRGNAAQLVLVSDGSDNASRISREEILAQLNPAVPIHVLRIRDDGADERAEEQLRSLAEASHGTFSFASMPDQLEDKLHEIAGLLPASEGVPPRTARMQISEIAKGIAQMGVEQAEFEQLLKKTYVEQRSSLGPATRARIADRKQEMLNRLPEITEQLRNLAIGISGSAPGMAGSILEGVAILQKAEAVRRLEYGIEYIRAGRQIEGWSSREGPLTQSLNDLAEKLREALDIYNGNNPNPAQGPASTVLAQAMPRQSQVAPSRSPTAPPQLQETPRAQAASSEPVLVPQRASATLNNTQRAIYVNGARLFPEDEAALAAALDEENRIRTELEAAHRQVNTPEVAARITQLNDELKRAVERSRQLRASARRIPDFYVGPLSDLPGDDRKTNEAARLWSESFAASLPSRIKKAEQELEAYRKVLQGIPLPWNYSFQAGRGRELDRRLTELRDIAQRMKTETVPIRLSNLVAFPPIIYCADGQNWTPFDQCPSSPDQPIRPSDVIAIEAPRMLTGVITIGSDGRFNMPPIGEVEAEGKTARELAQELQRRLGEFLTIPEVHVRLLQSTPQTR